MTPASISLIMECPCLGPRRFLLEEYPWWTMSIPLPPSIFQRRKELKRQGGKEEKVEPPQHSTNHGMSAFGGRRILLESPGWTMSMPSPPSSFEEKKDKQDKAILGTTRLRIYTIEETDAIRKRCNQGKMIARRQRNQGN